jgi:adenylate cyclase
MEFTAIGDGVNLGSRLESASKQYGCDIIISENTYQPCSDRVRVCELDKIIVKGRTQPVSIYEVVGLLADRISDQKQRIIDLYQEGRRLYLKREFALAIGQFAQVMAIDPNNKAADLHMDRCQYWLKQSPPEDWDGVWTMKEK